jgi:hypothetical protein
VSDTATARPDRRGVCAHGNRRWLCAQCRARRAAQLERAREVEQYLQRKFPRAWWE